MSRLQSIQYLRGLAATMVVFFHTTPPEIGLIGAAGVDIFFVISGFIMWALCADQAASPGKFFRDRIVRIVPLYWMYTTILATAAALVPSAFPRLHATFEHYVLSLFFVPYRDLETHQILPILAQGWTLNFEMFFYIVVAISLFFQSVWRFSFIAGLLVVLPIIGWLAKDDNALVATYTSPIVLEFLAGMGICILWRNSLLPGPRRSLLFFFASVAAFLGAAVVGLALEPWRVVAWGGPSALMVMSLLSIERHGLLPKINIASMLGDASYSVYLSHSFTISVWRRLSSGWFGAVGYSVTALVLCLVGGIVAFRLIEAPLLRGLRSRTFRPAVASAK
jgi:exopolysaccharide production protein ExoZ